MLGKDIPNTIGLSGYNFEHCPTKTAAGGAGIFIADSLEYEIRSDLQMNLNQCEDFWVNVHLKKFSKKCRENELIVGIVYRHPGSQFKEFEEKICGIINNLNQLRMNFVIMGDTHLNFEKVNLVRNITDYYNNIQGAGCLSLVNRATRVVRRGSKWQTSCLDHIYTNISIDKTESYIITSDISDHFSTLIKLDDARKSFIPKHEVFV